MHRHKVPGKMISMIILLVSLCPSKAQDATQMQDAPFAKIMTGSSGSVENVTFEDFSDQTKDDTGNLKREISSTGISEDILCYNYDVTKCKATKKGKEYRGKVAKTKSGKTCQAWTSHRPHEHYHITPETYPDSGLENNYCRNPTWGDVPWCYTTDAKLRAEPCDIPDCQTYETDEKCCTETVDKGSRAFTEIPIKTQSDFPSFTKREVEINDVAKCKKTKEGKEYRGKIAKTKSGKTCQAWDSQKPHKHDVPPADYPDAGLDSNYCRNPNYQDVPWCYTDDPKTRFELCAIPECPLYQTDLKIVGQRVYSSQVYKIMEDSNYPPSEQIDETKEYNMIIKADSFYCDKDINIEGLTKFTVVARFIVSNNCTINLKHDGMTMKPDMSETFHPNHGRTSTVLERKNGRDGADGINGKDGTNVVVGLITGSGTLNIETNGANGLEGGDGGDGIDGSDGKHASCVIKCRYYDCSSDMKGTPAGDGGDGSDAGAAGKPGNGGGAGEIKVIVSDTRRIQTKLRITGCKGDKGPTSSSPGKAGKGGLGGNEAGDKRCYDNRRFARSGRFGSPRCKEGKGEYFICYEAGLDGSDGHIRPTTQATEGSNVKITLSNVTEEIKAIFDETVLELSLEQADEAYMQGKDDEAKEICTSFLMKIDMTSFSGYCNRIMTQMSSGLNYFGYKDNEFPSLDVKTVKNDIKHLLSIADSKQKDINDILKFFQSKDIMKVTIRFTSQTMGNAINLEKKEVNNLVGLEQNLKRKTIEKLMDMESRMSDLANKIETDIEKARVARDRTYAKEARELALALVGGLVSFAGGNPFEKVEAAIGGINDVMNFVEKKEQNKIDGQSCYSKYKEMKKFADIMMQVKPFKAANPFETKLSDIPSVATAELLKVQTLEKRDDLLLGFKCLIDNSGFAGDTLEGTIGAFFDYSFSRLNLIGEAIQHDIQLKQYQFREERLESTIKAIRGITKASGIALFNPTLERAQLLFKERMIASFRTTERTLLRNLYIESMAFQFITLWEPKLLSKAAAMRKPQTMATSGAIFTGHVYLRDVNDYLENLKRKWRSCMKRRSIGKSTYLWILTPQTHKKLFQKVRSSGIGSFTITKEGICSTPKECVNLRIEEVFVEVYGKGLFSNQSVVHVHLTHSGQNLIYMPPDGSTTKYYMQATTKTVILGAAMKGRSRTGCRNGGWRCTSKFPEGVKKGTEMCATESPSPFEELAGTEPCRSLFSEYTISFPKNEHSHESVTMNNKHLDWTKIKKIKFYAALRTYKNYPSENDCA